MVGGQRLTEYVHTDQPKGNCYCTNRFQGLKGYFIQKKTLCTFLAIFTFTSVNGKEENNYFLTNNWAFLKVPQHIYTLP